MKHIKIYKPPDGPAQAAEFIKGLEPRLRDKVVRQILYLSRTPLPELKEPHYKHFSIEKYQKSLRAPGEGAGGGAHHLHPLSQRGLSAPPRLCEAPKA